MSEENISLKTWTATVRLNNGQVTTIWYTCWPSIKHIISKVLSITVEN